MSLLRIAVPNKGSLAQSAAEILRESGYRQRDDAKQLTLTDAENGVEFFYLRPRDIALYVGEGTLDVGITGRDLLRDSGAKAEEVLPLGFGRSRFRFAGPIGRYAELDELGGTRIATSYVGVVSAFLQERGIEAEVVRLDGAVETSVQLGVADVVADVVETGSTLRQAGLEVFDMRSIDELGMRAVMERALAGVDENTHLHVSFDVDFLDPDIAPGVGTTVPGGPTYREAQLCMEMIADTGQLASLDVMELNPALDVRNRTASLAVDLIESLFGKSTLMRKG